MVKRLLPILDNILPESRDLPTVRALTALWQEVSSRPLYAPPHFWRYLKLRWQVKLKFLDPQSVVMSAPLGKINDCSSCFDICCVGPRSTVLLRLRDIATLMDIGRTDLMTHHKPQFAATELAQRPALNRVVHSRGWSTFPVLKQNSYGACEALNSDGKCTLYPYWPMSCARFPYSLHAEDGDIFYSQRCDSFWVHPSLAPRVRIMATLAVESYNERLRDLILLAYVPEKLAALGLTHHLATDLKW